MSKLDFPQHLEDILEHLHVVKWHSSLQWLTHLHNHLKDKTLVRLKDQPWKKSIAIVS